MNISIHNLERSQDQIVNVMDVGNRVKQSRLAAGYSLDDLAATCGLTVAEISRIEDAVEIDMQHLRRIAPALKVSVESLLEADI